MTFANVKSTGRGRIRARLTVAGLPSCFVTHKTMEQTHADGRTWIYGLLTDTIKWGVTADIPRASLSVDGFTATLKDMGKAVSAVLGKRPQQVTRLNADLTAAATTVTVFDTSGFPTAGTIHIATEAISYTNTNATQFTGCTRGVWGTTAQAHYTNDGAGLAYPRVTDHPEGVEGRPVTLAFYGDGDSGTGAGTDVFRGVTNRGARYSQGTWTIGIDPVTRILDQSIGGDLNEPVPIRGIHYTSAAPLILILNWNDGADVATVRIADFYDDQVAFCEALTAAIATATAGWGWGAGSSITAQPTDIGWDLIYTIGAAGTAANVMLDTTRIPVPAGRPIGDRVTSTLLDDQLDPLWVGADGVPTTAPVLSGVYKMSWAAPVPRATVGLTDEPEDVVVVGGTSLGDPQRIYLGGTVTPTTNMLMTIGGSGDENVTLEVSSVNTSDRWVEVDCPFMVLGPTTTLQIQRILVVGQNLNGLRAQLITDAPTYANAGAMPLITAADIADSPDVDAAAAEHGSIGSNRNFIAGKTCSLSDIIEPELRAISCFARIGTSGAIEWVRIRATQSSDTADYSIGEADVVGWPTVERGQYGTLSEVEFKTGYDVKEDKHLGQPIRFRDVGACSPNRVSQTLEIGQKSLPRNYRRVVTLADVRSAVSPVLGLFGTEYDVISLFVGMRFFDVKIGDVISLTSSKVPATDGTLGVTNELAMVTATGFDLSTGKISLQLLRHGQRFAGYAPEFRVTGAALVSGTTYDLTCNIADYTDAASLASWLTAGDLVRVLEKDVSAPTSHNATIVSFPSSTVARVLFTGAFTIGTSEWSLGLRESTHYASTGNLARFMFSATTTRRITHSDTTVDARMFSP